MTKRIKDNELDDISGGTNHTKNVEPPSGPGNPGGGGGFSIIGDESGGGRPIVEQQDGNQNVEGGDDITNMEQNG